MVGGYLKWEGKNGGLGALPPADSRGKALVEVWGTSPPEGDNTFCENVLFLSLF